MSAHCWEWRESVPLDEPCPCKCERHCCDECLGGKCYYGVQFSPGATCLLEHGHAGEHEWTLNSEIVVEFTGEEP